MLVAISRNHVRRNLTSTTKQMFPMFSTSFGWLGKKMKPGSLEEDITGELGVTVMIYFKQLKALMVLFLILTLFSLPQFYLIST